MDCINWGPCNLYFEFAQTEQDISDPCVMNVRQAHRNHCNSEAATPENVFDVCNVFCPNGALQFYYRACRILMLSSLSHMYVLLPLMGVITLLMT